MRNERSLRRFRFTLAVGIASVSFVAMPLTPQAARGPATAHAPREAQPITPGATTAAPCEGRTSIALWSDPALLAPRRSRGCGTPMPLLPGSTLGPGVTAAVGTPAVLAPPDVIVGEGAGSVNLTVRLADEGLSTVTVAYTTANSTAVGSTSCDFDYVGVTSTLTFLPGETTKVVPVTVLDCPDVEGFQSFTLELSSPTNATIARASTRVGIVDNDTVVATPRLFVRDATVDEKDGNARVSVLLGGTSGQASASTVTVDYTTSTGTATAGSDYGTTSGTLTFLPGETAKTIPVSIVDDAAAEPPEDLTVNLSSPVNATITDGTGVVVIGASDAAAVGAPALSAPPDVIVGEGDGFVDLPVRLSVPGLSTVTVAYTNANSSAIGSTSCNFDYVGVNGTLSFAPGETTKTIRIDLLDCPDVEGFQSFTLELSSPTNATIARASTRVGIVDNDTLAATPALFVRDTTADEKDGNARVSVLLGGTAGQASGSAVTVAYSTSSGTATADSDYSTTAGTLTFAPGETAKTIVIPITDDAAAEPAEDSDRQPLEPGQRHHHRRHRCRRDRRQRRRRRWCSGVVCAAGCDRG